MIEQHPLQPFIPDESRILMLGSFPPAQKRWCMDFYYPNFNNDMWRIFGIIFYHDKFHFLDVANKTFNKEAIIECLTTNHIAIYDTASAVRRTKNTASDKDLEIIRATDLDALLKRIPRCTAVVTTGQKATDTFVSHFDMKEPVVGGYSVFTFEDKVMRLYRMPSSSRAYPMKVEHKAEFYQNMFNEIIKQISI